MSGELQVGFVVFSYNFHYTFGEEHCDGLFRVRRIVGGGFLTFNGVYVIVSYVRHTVCKICRPYFLVNAEIGYEHGRVAFVIRELVPEKHAHVITVVYIVAVKFGIVFVRRKTFLCERGGGPAFKRQTFSDVAFAWFPTVGVNDSGFVFIENVIFGGNVVVYVAIPVQTAIEFVKIFDTPLFYRKVVCRRCGYGSAYAYRGGGHNAQNNGENFAFHFVNPSF